MLVPADWSFEGGIGWSPDNTLMPATYGFHATGSGIAVQALPGQPFTWTSLLQVRLGHPVGSSYLGGIFCPRLGATDFIRKVIVPSLRQNAAGIRITDQGPAGAFDGALGLDIGFESTGAATTEGSRLRIEYDEGGKSYEEELFCTITSFSYRIPAGGSEIAFVIWLADNMFSFRAEKGGLDRNAGILQSMVYSLKLNPRWLETYNRIVVFLKDGPAYRPASLRQLSADAVNIAPVDDVGGYTKRHSAYTWIAGNLARARATAEYYDPIQQICVRLPAAGGHAWANGTGEYMLSDRNEFPYDSGVIRMWNMMEPIGIEVPAVEPSTA